MGRPLGVGQGLCVATGLMQQKCVIIVDDDLAVLEVVNRTLSRAGHIVIAFNRFEDARAFLSRNRPDVLIADVRLGAYNGIHLAVQARECYTDVNIIVYSAYDDEVLRAEAERCGAAFLLKPLSGPEIVSAVEATPAARLSSL